MKMPKECGTGHPNEVYFLLEEAGIRGVTTGEIIRRTKDASHTKTIKRLRMEGYNITGDRIEGERQYRYVLHEKGRLY